MFVKQSSSLQMSGPFPASSFPLSFLVCLGSLCFIFRLSKPGREIDPKLEGTPTYWRQLSLKEPRKKNFAPRDPISLIGHVGQTQSKSKWTYCSDYRPNRILLDAEPQIGKTNSVLFLLALLQRRIQEKMNGASPPHAVPSPAIAFLPPPARIPAEYRNPLLWEMPYGCKVQDMLENFSKNYKVCSWGRYHVKALILRLPILAAIAEENPEGWYRRFVHQVLDAEGRYSDRLMELVENRPRAHLPESVRDFVEFERSKDGSGALFFKLAANTSKDMLIEAVDIDGRLGKSNWNESRRGPYAPLKLALKLGLITLVGRRGAEWYRYARPRSSLLPPSNHACSINLGSMQQHFETVNAVDFVPFKAPRPTISVESKEHTFDFTLESAEERWAALSKHGEFSCHSGSLQNKAVFSVPPSAAALFVDFPTRANNGHHWVFTPSYQTHTLRTLDAFALGDRPHVVVVRSTEWKEYKAAYGRSHILMQLPDRITLGSGEECEVQEVSSGCGYARRMIQIISYLMGLDWIHVWDDNVRLWFSSFVSFTDP